MFIDYFLKELSTEYNKSILSIDNQTIDILTAYDWNGNIRELKNVLEQMIVLCRDGIISKSLIPKYILESISHEKKNIGLQVMVENYEKRLIIEALKEVNGNIARAAKKLKIPRSTLYYKMDNYKINVDILK